MVVQSFAVMDLHEYEQLRRSAAIGNGLTPSGVQQLFELVDDLLEERRRLVGERARLLDERAHLLSERTEVRLLLDGLGPSWRSARTVLNRLSRMVR